MLQTLELTNIRSYSSGLFEFSKGVNIIVGPNASGKTNLLEAVQMSATNNTFKSDDLNMVKNTCQWARIDAVFDGVERTVKIKTIPKINKTITVDGVEKSRISTSDLLPVVLFEPYDMLLLGGEPDRRRAYIDRVLCQISPNYNNTLKDYRRALSQRNKLLKQATIGPDHLFVWNVRLSKLAGEMVDKRLWYIDALQRQLSENYQNVSGTEDILSVVYESKISPLDNYETAMLKKLNDQFEIDRNRGFTGAGPHRDDMVIFINDNDVRLNASRGETRSIVLALKVAELRAVETHTGKSPLLLLDDVFSELDGRRRRMLAQTLQNYQTIITTTDADVVTEHFSALCNIIPL